MDVRTLCDIPRLLQAEQRRSDQLLYKEAGAWRAISTQDLCHRIRELAVGLLGHGVGHGDRVAILSENRPEWAATDFAILACGAVTVPIYTTLLAEQIEYILRDCDAAGIVVSSREQLDKVLAVRPRLPNLRVVVLMEPGFAPPPGARQWHELAEAGAAALVADPEAGEDARGAVKPEDLASIIYTSGTTGTPKGVMLTHANFVHNIKACCAAVPIRSTDICLSLLPLSHIYERLVEYCYFYRAASIAYAESLETAGQAMLEIRPTIACGVPRMFEKMHRRILDAAGALPPARRRVFQWAMGVARRHGTASGDGRHPGFLLEAQHRLAERLVFRELRQRLGGRLRFFISGGAPLARELAEQFHGAGIIILEGYGLTETSAVVTVNRLDSVAFGTVGLPVEGVEVRIAPDGEVLVKGPTVMKGYLGDQAATREAIRDGWFYTGDIGAVGPRGHLGITDRKKELLKTSGGKMVAPQPIENLLRSDPYIAQAMVVGDGRRFVAALVVPQLEAVRAWAGSNGVAGLDLKALCRAPAVSALLEDRIAVINRRLPRYEQIKKFCLIDAEFTQETGEMTPTLKYRRKVIESRHRAAIEKMYAEEAARSGAGAAISI